MKKYIYILLTVVFTMSLVSCEEIVDLDLRSVDPLLVIDATIKENAPCVVLLSTTQDYYNNSSVPTVSGGIITLSDDAGNTEVLIESMPGVYQSHAMFGTANKTYTLNVKVGDDSYTATSKLLETVAIDSLYIYNIEVGTEHFYSPTVIFDDPADVKNYYYYTTFVNGARLSTIYVGNDEYKNGRNTHEILFFDKEDNDDRVLEIGDTIRVEMRTIDSGAYDFYLTMMYSVAAGGGTNPISNFSGEVLGCFSAYGLSTREIIIDESNIYTKKAN